MDFITEDTAGDTFERTWQFMDNDNNPVDLTGAVIQFALFLLRPPGTLRVSRQQVKLAPAS